MFASRCICSFVVCKMTQNLICRQINTTAKTTSKYVGGSVDTDSLELITKLSRTKVTNLENKKINDWLLHTACFLSFIVSKLTFIVLLAATRAEELKAKPNSMIQTLLQDSATSKWQTFLKTRYIHYTTCIDQGIQRTRTTSVLASFCHSSTSVYYTKPKPNNKNGGREWGYVCTILWLQIPMNHQLAWDIKV